MFAASTAHDIFVAAGGIILATLVVGIAASFVHLFRDRTGAIKLDADDMGKLTGFFFDTERDPRTRTPFREGWTTKIDRVVGEHTEKLNEIGGKVDQVLAEVVSDGNGGHNLHGAVIRAAEAAAKAADLAETEASAQEVERDRVHRKEANE